MYIAPIAPPFSLMPENCREFTLTEGGACFITSVQGSGSDLVSDQHAISSVDQVATAPCTDPIQA